MASVSNVVSMPIGDIKPNPKNARTHSRKQIGQLAASIKEFTYFSPVVVDETNMLIAGHGRLEAAKSLDMTSVPTIVVTGLSELQKRRLMLSDNKITGNAGWDRELLATEIHEITIEDADIVIHGFEPAEIDGLLSAFETDSGDPADTVVKPPEIPMTRRGDLWLLGKHRLLCGDARSAEDVERLCGDDVAAMAFLDPPYNVRVDGIVGRGEVKHEEFAMASGEMSTAEFRTFLNTTLTNAANVSKPGAVHFVCMDWRHFADLMTVADAVYGTILNTIAWVKSNAGQGSFYRSQHELIGVFRAGAEPHLNNVELGRHGRNRTNVWQYAGVNSFGRDRLDELHAHPTVKPVAMIAEAIKDCTRRHDYVLDTFAGSGTTILACERVGRRGLGLEYEPKYVDVAIRRWQQFTGKDAINAETGQIFDEIATMRESR